MASRNKRLRVGCSEQVSDKVILQEIKQELATESNDKGTDQLIAGYPGQSHKSNQFDLPPLPDIVVKEILRTVPDWPTIQTLLNCRLVSVQWNQIIEDTAALMEKIAFPIWHPIPFLQLPIVQKGKVKSIVLKNYFSPKLVTMLMDKIGDTTIEKVQVAFDDSCTKKQQQELFGLILHGCKNLQEVIIGDCEIPQKFFSQPAQLWHVGLSDLLGFDGCKTIKRLTVNMHSFTVEDANGLVDLILLLPKLEEIKLVCVDSYGEYFSTFLMGLLKYLKVFKADLRLKKIAFCPDGRPLPKENHAAFMALLITCTKAKHRIILPQMPFVNFNTLLALPEPQVLLSVQSLKLDAKAKFSGQLKFKYDPPALRNLILTRLNLLDIWKLDLVFLRSVTKEDVDVSWIQGLTKLESLSLACHKDIFICMLPIPSAKEVEVIISEGEGLPALKTLKLHNDLLDASNVTRWSQYFPSLQELWISYYITTPADLISKLTLFESLSTLQLRDLPNLQDESFTVECVNRFPSTNTNNDLPLKSPAIACFKGLKHLRLYGCTKLTSECILNGIKRCKTLETLHIQNCGSINETCKSWMLNCKVYFSNKAEELSSCSSSSGDSVQMDSSEDSFQYLSDQSDDASFVSDLSNW